jgi:hypothetical protein
MLYWPVVNGYIHIFDYLHHQTLGERPRQGISQPLELASRGLAMTKITDRCFEATRHTAFICDILVAYNPARAVRVNSAMLAAAIKQQAGRDVAFTLK